MKKIGLLNGPNLDRLGKREPDIYGSQTLDEIVQNTVSLGSTLGCEVVNFQSNHEGAMIDKIHEWADAGVCWINPESRRFHSYERGFTRCGSSIGIAYH